MPHFRILKRKSHSRPVFWLGQRRAPRIRLSFTVETVRTCIRPRQYDDDHAMVNSLWLQVTHISCVAQFLMWSVSQFVVLVNLFMILIRGWHLRLARGCNEIQPYIALLKQTGSVYGRHLCLQVHSLCLKIRCTARHGDDFRAHVMRGSSVNSHYSSLVRARFRPNRSLHDDNNPRLYINASPVKRVQAAPFYHLRRRGR